MDIVVWLRSLGLGKYEAAFRENEIDETVLPNLTPEDLKELGVSLSGTARNPRCHCCSGSDASGKAPPLTQRPRRVRQALIPKTAPSAAKSP